MYTNSLYFETLLTAAHGTPTATRLTNEQTAVVEEAGSHGTRSETFHEVHHTALIRSIHLLGEGWHDRRVGLPFEGTFTGNRNFLGGLELTTLASGGIDDLDGCGLGLKAPPWIGARLDRIILFIHRVADIAAVGLEGQSPGLDSVAFISGEWGDKTKVRQKKR